MLYLDCGNTALKSRYNDIDSIFTLNDARFDEKLTRYLQTIQNNEQVVMSSVASQETFQHIQERITEYFDKPILLAQTESHFNELKIGYSVTSQLGIDRWLTFIATQHIPGLRIIIDAGTWIKMDAIKQSQHLGGLIISSSPQAEKALFNRFDIQQCPTTNALLGNSTEECVCIPKGQYHLESMVHYLQQWLRYFNQPCHLIISGGDASLIQQAIQSIDSELQKQLIDIQFTKNLVLLGLTIRYPD